MSDSVYDAQIEALLDAPQSAEDRALAVVPAPPATPWARLRHDARQGRHVRGMG